MRKHMKNTRDFVYVRTGRPDSYKPGFSSVPTSLFVVGGMLGSCRTVEPPCRSPLPCKPGSKIDALALSCPVPPEP